MTYLLLIVPLFFATSPAGPLDAWQHPQIARVLNGADCHSIHAYYLACPESPDGRQVVIYTSTGTKGYLGEVRVVERATGKQIVLAKNVTVEDAHRAACQQWISGGRRVAFHDLRDGHWVVVCVDVATGREQVLARDRKIGFGQPGGDLVPVYSPHFNPGEHRDMELVDAATGATRTALTAEEVKRAYPEWIARRFGERPVSIFFPVLSPDLRRVIFKMSTPGDGNFRSGKASTRSGLIACQLDGRRLLCLRNWGHPAWHPESRAVLDLGSGGVALTDLESGRTLAAVVIPKFGAGHPSVSPDGRLFCADRAVAGAGDVREVLVGDLARGEWRVIARFENGRGAASWRRNDPHPVFSADGRRIYYNVGAERWTRVFVAEKTREERREQ